MSKEIDEHVRALIKLGVSMVLDHDSKLGVYILPAYIEEEGDPDSGRPDDRLEYQVSNGLDGRRSYSHDHYTYVEALEEFKEMCAEVALRRSL